MCPSVCFGIQARAKSWTPFLLGYIVNVALMLILKRSRSVPLMGGPQGPSVSRSPGTAPQKKAGRPMGPSTPLCQPQSFLILVSALMLKPTGLCIGICCGALLWGNVSGSLSPSSFGPCFVYCSGSPWDPVWVGGASSS